MTKQEFIDDITTWSELIEFCYNEGIDFCDNVYDAEGYDNRIIDELSDFIQDGSWQDIKNWLYFLPEYMATGK